MRLSEYRRGISDSSDIGGRLFAAGALFDARLRIDRVLSLQAGAGVGGTLAWTRAEVRDDSRTTSSLQLGLAWSGEAQIDISYTNVRVVLGATGLLHRDSHDILYFTGACLFFR